MRGCPAEPSTRPCRRCRTRLFRGCASACDGCGRACAPACAALGSCCAWASRLFERPFSGYALFTAAIGLLVSGIVLTRVEGVIVVKDPTARGIAYWLHVLLPLVCGWLFVLHRLAGKKIRWSVGLRWAGVSGAFAAILCAFGASGSAVSGAVQRETALEQQRRALWRDA